jgi:hypothetical protein
MKSVVLDQQVDQNCELSALAQIGEERVCIDSPDLSIG